MKDKRPVNLDIGTMRLPITAWASITHRATGVFLFVGMAILLCALDASLKSPGSFNSLKECLSGFFASLVIWAVLVALVYHSLAGIKHMIMDFGVGESLEGGVLGARIVIGVSAIAAVVLFVMVVLS